MLSAALYARVRTSRAHCTRDRGCSAHPAFPAPSDFQRSRKLHVNLGRNAPREGEATSGWATVIASEGGSNPFLSFCGAMDCFASLAMTGKEPASAPRDPVAGYD